MPTQISPSTPTYTRRSEKLRVYSPASRAEVVSGILLFFKERRGKDVGESRSVGSDCLSRAPMMEQAAFALANIDAPEQAHRSISKADQHWSSTHPTSL